MYVLLFYGFILNFQSNSSNGVLNGHETDSACEEDIFDDDIKEILGDEPESVIPQQVLDLADHALARLKDISTLDFSTPDFSTPSFNHGPFNPRLFNHELFKPKFFEPWG